MKGDEVVGSSRARNGKKNFALPNEAKLTLMWRFCPIRPGWRRYGRSAR